MATATAAPKKKSANTGGEPVQVVRIPLKEIVSNSGQSRGMGVIASLKELGYGLFEKITAEQEQTIWGLLTSDKEEERTEGARLIAENEPKIVETATAIDQEGQLQPIGVVKDDEGYDVIFGMRRAIAKAYLYATAPDKHPAEVNAQVFPGKLSDLDRKYLSYSENNAREDESPMDRAIFYKDMVKGQGIKIADLATRIDRSPQHVKDYISLLDPKLEDKRIMIHNREMSVDRALKLLKARKEQGDDAEEDKGTDDRNRQRARFPSFKTIQRIYAGTKPKDFTDERWEMWTSEPVRRFLAKELGFRYKPYTPPKETAKAETNGDGKSGKGGVKLNIPRGTAQKLLVSLGKTNAGTWDDNKLKETLENIVNIAEPGQKIEGGDKLQSVLDRLLGAYEKGLTVTIKAPEKAEK